LFGEIDLNAHSLSSSGPAQVRQPSKPAKSRGLRPARAAARGIKTRPVLVGAAGAAAALAASALFVQLRTRRAESDNPPVGKFVDVDGVRLHYIVRGRGSPVVLLHGNGALVQDFTLSDLVKRLAKNHRVFVFDRPGYGYSTRPRGRGWTPEAQAELFRNAFDELGIDEPVVLGHSWGAMVAMALGLDHPEAVKSLVLVAGYFYPTARADVAFFSTPAIPVAGTLMRYTISPLIGRSIWPALMRKIFGPNPMPKAFEKFPKWLALRPETIRAAAVETAMLIPAAARLSKRYSELAVPTVIVAGDADRLVTTKRQSERLHEELSGSTFHLVPGVGHMVHHIAPEAVLAAIDEAAAQGAEPIPLKKRA
jgi:pimeloyl-ACP methyl ester carboxylesterase